RNSVLLFMVPADSPDIKAEYNVLLNELKQYSPELMDKDRILAVTKCDMLDKELEEAVRKELPQGLDHVLISSVANQGLDELKDLIWSKIHTTLEPTPPPSNF